MLWLITGHSAVMMMMMMNDDLPAGFHNHLCEVFNHSLCAPDIIFIIIIIIIIIQINMRYDHRRGIKTPIFMAWLTKSDRTTLFGQPDCKTKSFTPFLMTMSKMMIIMAKSKTPT